MRVSRRPFTGRGMLRVAVVIAVGLGAASCLGGCASAGGSPTGTPTSTASITGDWRLVSGHDGTGKFDLTGVVVTLRVDGSKSGGSGPCNGYGESIDGSTTGTIRLTRGVSTDMACVPQERNVLEARYFAVLGGTMSASLENGDLVLASARGTLAYEPTKSAQ